VDLSLRPLVYIMLSHSVARIALLFLLKCHGDGIGDLRGKV